MEYNFTKLLLLLLFILVSILQLLRFCPFSLFVQQCVPVSWPIHTGVRKVSCPGTPIIVVMLLIGGILLNPDHIDVHVSRTQRRSVPSSCWIPSSWLIVFQGVTSIVKKGCISASRLAAPVPTSSGRRGKKRDRIRPTKSWGLHYHTFLRGSKAPPLLVLLLSCLLILPVTYWW